MGFGAKPKGPSAEQLKLQQEQADLAKKQQAQLETEKSRLAQQESEASRQAEVERQRRIKSQKAARLKTRGRSSLIATGSELGTADRLG